MSNTVISPAVSTEPPAASGAAWATAVFLALWFALVLLLGARGDFVRPAGAPPFPILLGATVPLILFFREAPDADAVENTGPR
jgi:hypothetical protein